MDGLNVTVRVQDVEQVKMFIKASSNLLEQIEINDYHDSQGHDIKMNKAYSELKKVLKNELNVKDYTDNINKYFEEWNEGQENFLINRLFNMMQVLEKKLDKDAQASQAYIECINILSKIR